MFLLSTKLNHYFPSNIDTGYFYFTGYLALLHISSIGGAGDWSNKGCTRRRTYNHTIECACDHMTNFAALVVSREWL